MVWSITSSWWAAATAARNTDPAIVYFPRAEADIRDVAAAAYVRQEHSSLAALALLVRSREVVISKVDALATQQRGPSCPMQCQPLPTLPARSTASS